LRTVLEPANAKIDIGLFRGEGLAVCRVHSEVPRLKR
jgi:hypothetical protein